MQTPGESRPSSIIVIFSNAGASVAFMAPFLGIAFDYDALSRESGTLRVLLSRPVYRDDIVNGKIISSLAVISITLFTETFLTVSISLDEVVRLILFCIFFIDLCVCILFDLTIHIGFFKQIRPLACN